MLNKLSIIDNKPFSNFELDFNHSQKINVAMWDEVDFDLVLLPFARTSTYNQFTFETFTSVQRSVEKFRFAFSSYETRSIVKVDFEFDNPSPFSKNMEDELDEIEELKDWVQALLNRFGVGKSSEANKYIYALYIMDTTGMDSESDRRYKAMIRFELKRMYLVVDKLIKNSTSQPLMSKFIYFDINEYKSLGRVERFEFGHNDKFLHSQFLAAHLREIVIAASGPTAPNSFLMQLNLKLRMIFDQISDKKYEVLEFLIDRKNEIKIRIDTLIKTIPELNDEERLALFIFINDPFIGVYELGIIRNLHKDISLRMLNAAISYFDRNNLKTVISFSDWNSLPSQYWRSPDVPYLFVDRTSDVNKDGLVSVKQTLSDDPIIEQWLSLKIGFTMVEENKKVYIFCDTPITAITMRKMLMASDTLQVELKDETTIHYIRDMWVINDAKMFDKSKFDTAKVIFAIGEKYRLVDFQNMILNDTKISTKSKQEIEFMLLDSDGPLSKKDLHKIEESIRFALKPKSSDQIDRENRAKIRAEKQKLRGW